MTKKIIKLITLLVFLLTAGCIGILHFMLNTFFRPQERKQWQTRIVIPQQPDTGDFESDNRMEQMVYQDTMNAKADLNNGEALIMVLTQDLDGDLMDEQILAYRNFLEPDSPIFITYVAFDETQGEYRRFWNSSTAVTRPGTLSVYIQDLIGDRSPCILVSGMNGAGEHILTVFRGNSQQGLSIGQGVDKIAELRIDGAILVQETERTQAYQRGLVKGQSFNLAAYGRDQQSSNILDQVEIIYSFNTVNGLYEQSRITRVPGSQIEQRRVRELLSGGKGEFERFITGLWYYVGPQGTLDNRQYIYFDPPNREIIFYGEDIQQVFTWQNSGATRYGLYVSSQNISVTTLRRFLDIELESLDSIQIKVFEDVRLKIAVSVPWNGSYRKAGSVDNRMTTAKPENTVPPYIDAVYDGSIGRLVFSADGYYTLYSGGIPQKRGKYVFFMLENQELLELRPQTGGGLSRETYRVEHGGVTNFENAGENITLVRIRLGTRGVQELHEAAISLALIDSGV